MTTDEVLTEYLAFFSSAKPSVRTQAGSNVIDLIHNSVVLVIAQSRDSFLSGLELSPRAARQRVQSDGLHFHADDPAGRDNRSPDQRPSFEQEGFRALLRDF